MPYIVNFTDNQNKRAITVYDNTASTETSVTFPGRNVSGYGQIIAENFLHLLENFANGDSPENPIEGQLWYDTTERNLKIWNNSDWKAAGSVQKGSISPAEDQSNPGELWVDTGNQQLYLFSGSRWILVGPTFSSGLRSGPVVDSILDSDNIERTILTFYIDDIPVIIFSKDSFTPRLTIDGFITIRSGLNITDTDVGLGGFETKLWGTVENAEALVVPNEASPIPASRFLRSDVVNTLEFGLNIKNNSGITIGSDNSFNISSSLTASKIYNSDQGSSIDLQVNRGGIPYTTLRVIENRVGINVASPNETLEVDGNAIITGSLVLTDTTASTNFNNGTFRVSGGIAVAKNILVGNGIDITGSTNVQNVTPKIDAQYDLGSETRRWNVVRTKTLVADSIEGILTGNISGNASTATNLRSVTAFKLEGDVISPAVQFDGQLGGLTKTFVTSLTASIISDKPTPAPNVSQDNDTILVFRSGTGLIKETRNVFIADLGVPIGSIMPYAGSEAPDGYLLCDGSEVERAKYRKLFDIIGATYNGSAPLVGVGTYRLPDLRGRFPLGKDNMDNGIQVPISAGGFVDAGGGNADRILGTAPDILGNNGGTPTTTLTSSNLPDHEHSMQGSTGERYYAFRTDTAIPEDSGSFLGFGPTATGRGQYLPSSGGIKTEGSLREPLSVMNPYLTLNYIIRSGPPAF
jgi:microcystin-dependent protein